MKVLQLGKFYPIRGGVEKVMYDLMVGLSARRIHCDMLCAAAENHPACTISLNAYAKLMVVPTQFKLAATMLAPSMIVELRKIAENYDIIHVHHPDPMACIALFFSGYKGKVVLHWHSDILKQKYLLKLYKPLQNWLINRADLIVGTSPIYVQKSPFLQAVEYKLDYIPIGVLPMKACSQKVRAIRAQYPNKWLIFSLGRLVDYKGYEHLIRSAQYLDDHYHILIGGKGPLMGRLRALVQALGLQEKVTFLGFIADEDVPNYFHAMDVFCLSSVWKTEAFGIVQIEAMSCGKPIVSTHIPGSGVSWVNLHELSGLVVKRADAAALAYAFKRLFTIDDLWQKLAEGGLARYEHYFTRERMIDKSVALYRKLGVKPFNLLQIKYRLTKEKWLSN